MSIVFAAITPHPPLLIPTVGKENLERLKDTKIAFKELEENLYASQPDTIIIISPHGFIQPTNFSINSCPELEGNFEEFGDFSTKLHFSGDVALAYKIREKMETKAPLQLISEPNLDHGCSVPLYLLTEHLPEIKIIPLYYSGLDLEAHYKFGHLLKHELLVNKDRIAIIASGDLSHSLTKDAPAGYWHKAKKFDKNLLEYLKNKKIPKIIKMNQEFIAGASECGLKSIMILLGILDGINYEAQMLSYEAPFGVGYLVMNFKL